MAESPDVATADASAGSAALNGSFSLQVRYAVGGGGGAATHVVNSVAVVDTLRAAGGH